jgi:hypothetical protein
MAAADQDAATYAEELVAVLETEGVIALARMFGCTRRRADLLAAEVRRAVAEGEELAPGALPEPTVRRALRTRVPATGTTAPTPLFYRQPTIEQRMAAEEVRRLEAIAERNAEAGYSVEGELADRLADARRKAGGA